MGRLDSNRMEASAGATIFAAVTPLQVMMAGGRILDNELINEEVGRGSQAVRFWVVEQSVFIDAGYGLATCRTILDYCLMLSYVGGDLFVTAILKL